MTLKKSDLAQFTGDLIRFRNPHFPGIIYTPGVRHVAEAGQAFWLIDNISIWLGSVEFNRARKADPRVAYMHFWKLEVNEDNTAVLTARADCDQPAFIQDNIPFTDFTLKEIEIWAGHDGGNWVLYLPSEH